MNTIKNVVSGRPYEKDGQKKTAWTKHGVLIEKDGKQFIKLESYPLPNENGEVWLSVFEQENKSQDVPF